MRVLKKLHGRLVDEYVVMRKAGKIYLKKSIVRDSKGGAVEMRRWSEENFGLEARDSLTEARVSCLLWSIYNTLMKSIMSAVFIERTFRESLPRCLKCD